MTKKLLDGRRAGVSVAQAPLFPMVAELRRPLPAVPDSESAPKAKDERASAPNGPSKTRKFAGPSQLQPTVASGKEPISDSK
jgi:hypothetical protein